MEGRDFPQTIEGCHKLIKQLLEITDALARTKELTCRVEKLEQENKALKERSSDKKKKKKNNKGSKNKGGGQPGHKGHSRKLLDSDKVDDIVMCRCPHTVNAVEGLN